MKDFLSSLLFILSWLIFAITAYLLFWTVMMPGWFIVPFVISLTVGIVTFWSSKRLGSPKERKHAGR